MKLRIGQLECDASAALQMLVNEFDYGATNARTKWHREAFAQARKSTLAMRDAFLTAEAHERGECGAVNGTMVCGEPPGHTTNHFAYDRSTSMTSIVGTWPNGR